jgi:hypothetical protein
MHNKRYTNQPPLVISDSRRGPTQNGGIVFSKAQAFKASEHHVVHFHATWKNYPRNGEELRDLLTILMWNGDWKFVDCQVRLPYYPKNQLSDETLPNGWIPLFKSSSMMVLRIPIALLGEIQGLFDAIKARTRWIYEYILDGEETTHGLNRNSEFSFDLLARSARDRHILIFHDADDDVFEGTLPICAASDQVVSKLLELGLAQQAK